MAFVVPVGVPQAELEPPISCPICLAQFVKRRGLIHHQETLHRRELFTCISCGKSFGSSCALRAHSSAKRHLIPAIDQLEKWAGVSAFGPWPVSWAAIAWTAEASKLHYEREMQDGCGLGSENHTWKQHWDRLMEVDEALLRLKPFGLDLTALIWSPHHMGMRSGEGSSAGATDEDGTFGGM